MQEPVLGVHAEFFLYLVPLVSGPDAEINLAQVIDHLRLPAKRVKQRLGCLSHPNHRADVNVIKGAAAQKLGQALGLLMAKRRQFHVDLTPEHLVVCLVHLGVADEVQPGRFLPAIHDAASP